jgi:hypothetical protein
MSERISTNMSVQQWLVQSKQHETPYWRILNAACLMLVEQNHRDFLDESWSVRYWCRDYLKTT